jgi:hypothetical protein
MTWGQALQRLPPLSEVQGLAADIGQNSLDSRSFYRV